MGQDRTDTGTDPVMKQQYEPAASELAPFQTRPLVFLFDLFGEI